MTSVTFESGTIADCMKKAAKVAPSKVGTSFDRASGIVFDISPGTPTPCVVRATDTEVFYTETIDVTKAEGIPVRWRLPSQLLANVVGTLPATAGKTVTFSQTENSHIVIASGRMKARLNVNPNPNYPEWEVTDVMSLRLASNFGASITRVEWAASKSGPPPMNGIYMDGQHIIATDKYRIARVPCSIDLPNGPVVIPAWSIGQLIKEMGDVLIGMDGTLFVVMPDDFTQIKTVTLGVDFPDLTKVVSLSYMEEVKLSKSIVIDKIQKAGNFAGADRAPILNLYIGRGELAVHMLNDEVGAFGDAVELPGQADHPRTHIRLTPRMLLDAMNNSPNDTLTLKYNPQNIRLPVCIDGDSGYEVWIAPRAEKTPEE